MIEARYDSLCRAAGPVSRETFLRVDEFARQFRKWNERINLTAPSTVDQLWERHVLDSAQILKLESKARTWVDIGSGGGFPGGVIAILLHDVPGASVTLVESNRKKSAFLRNALATLAPRAVIDARRAEIVVAQRQAPEIVTARAVAPLPALLDLLLPWLGAGATGLFHKGRDYRAELKLAHDSWNLDLVEHRSVIDDDSVILAVRKLRRK